MNMKQNNFMILHKNIDFFLMILKNFQNHSDRIKQYIINFKDIKLFKDIDTLYIKLCIKFYKISLKYINIIHFNNYSGGIKSRKILEKYRRFTKNEKNNLTHSYFL